MYLDYFGFQEEPFNITPNSKFLFMSARHREALAALLYGIEQRKGFIALTGEIGCGKTTICRAMLGKLDRTKTRLALVLNPEFNDVELLQTINAEYGLEAKTSSKRELLDTLNRFLLNEYKNDRNVVLLIDEAQRLPPGALEQVRLISNLETETAKLIQIALVGQPELADILDLPELEQLNQRITVRYHISPLTSDEVGEYVAHRINVARRIDINQPRLPIRFTKKALRKVFEYSSGVPRRVNVVCDRALLVTFVRDQNEVSEENVEKAIEELGGMPKRRRKTVPGHIRDEEEAIANAERRLDTIDTEEQSADVEEPAAAPTDQSNKLPVIAIAILAIMGIIGVVMTKIAYGPQDKIDSQLASLTAKGEQARTEILKEKAALPKPTVVASTMTSTVTPTVAPTLEVAQAIVRGTPTLAPVTIIPETPTPTMSAPTATPAPSVATPAPSETPSPSLTPESTVEVTTTPSPGAEEEFIPIRKLPRKTPTAKSTSTTPAPENATATISTTPNAETPAPTAPIVAATNAAGMLAQMMQSPTPTAKPAGSVEPWTYDDNGIVRVTESQLAYPAAVLTWLAAKRGDRMPENELSALRAMKREQVASLQLTTGRAPLFLREGRLPSNLSAITPAQLPVMLQFDDEAAGVGPWAILATIDGSNVTLLDPRAGRLVIPSTVIADHLSGVVAPYFDPKEITGLKPGSNGDAVGELQRLLTISGVYTATPTASYDSATSAAVTKVRAQWSINGGDVIDSALAARLIAQEDVRK